VFIETTRVVQKGEELGYDYEIGREKDDPPNVDEIFACRCGSPKCRGTMLWPAKDPRKKKAVAKKKAAPVKSTKGKPTKGKSTKGKPSKSKSGKSKSTKGKSRAGAGRSRR
jgi:hypothetical protein